MLGVVTGMLAEARCLRPGQFRFICSGGDAARARSGAEQLAAQGVAALISFGLAGGLAPTLRTGALLLPSEVVLPSGERLTTDPAWRQRLARLAQSNGLELLDLPVFGSDQLVADTAAKRALFEATGAGAVDMESHAVAAVARAAGLPCMVVRAIADPHDEALPAIARHGLGSDGRIRPVAVAAGLLRQPSALGAILRLGRASSRALDALRRVAALAPELAFL